MLYSWRFCAMYRDDIILMRPAARTAVGPAGYQIGVFLAAFGSRCSRNQYKHELHLYTLIFIILFLYLISIPLKPDNNMLSS